MCGRYYLFPIDPDTPICFPGDWPTDAILRRIADLTPRYNIAPSQTTPVIRLFNGEIRIDKLTWGFRPHWLEDQNKAQINARAETVFKLPMFKGAARERRCLIPASGWYEWDKHTGSHQPYAFHLSDGALFSLAGIWTVWHGEDGENQENFAVVTTMPSPLAAKVHTRMPARLSAEECATWLSDERDPAHLTHLLAPASDEDLAADPITKYVNNPAHTGPKCLARA